MNITFNVPLMTIAKFAEETGLSHSYVSKRTREGIFPIMPKKSPNESTLIDLVKLTKQMNLLMQEAA